MDQESPNFGHEHPMVLLNEKLVSDQSEEAVCSRCGKKVSAAPSFSCMDCGFYLHKKCAEAPSEINHPFHRDHPLVLLRNPPYASGIYFCDFCDEIGEMFVYHCSCELDFHINCALLTYNIAGKEFKELEHVALEDPLISIGTNDEEIGDPSKCFGCWEPLVKYTYFSPCDYGFNLHKKCSELPLKLNHMCHRKHPLVLQFNSERFSCKICRAYRLQGFVYCCSPCKFAIHIECASPSPIVEDKSHQHPFTLFWLQVPFICDACGTEGNHAAYTCSTCNIIVHRKCISLPSIIKSKWHDHRIFHTYFIQEEDFKSWNCIICHEEVNTRHGSYYCSDCRIIVHVNCAIKEKSWYYIVSLENEDEKSSDSLALLSDISVNSITSIIERSDVGEAIKIKHFKHMHNLMLSDKIMEYDKCCDGCLLPILASFYYCSQCDFVLHKACAELPKVKHVWHHGCQQPLILIISDNIFMCETCDHLSNGFAYKCNECDSHVCLRCVIALTPGAKTCQGHEHPLLFYYEYEGQCSACGKDIQEAFRCKDCNFALDCVCFSLPTTARHKCDEHLLILTYHDANNYSGCHYCDICEERRDPNHWFYHCATCDNSAHIKCVLGIYPFIKLGSICKEGDHLHPLRFVKKIYYYPECIECGEPCQDLALECAEPGCNFIVHCECHL